MVIGIFFFLKEEMKYFLIAKCYSNAQYPLIWDKKK